MIRGQFRPSGHIEPWYLKHVCNSRKLPLSVCFTFQNSDFRHTKVSVKFRTHLTTHIHKWCQSTFWQNWVKYITGIYGKRWFWKLRIKLSWLIWIKFKICLILWTPLLLVLSALRFKQWHSKVVLQWINEIEREKRQAKSNMSGASHYEIARLYNLHHLWLSRPGLKGNTVTYIWC